MPGTPAPCFLAFIPESTSPGAVGWPLGPLALPAPMRCQSPLSPSREATQAGVLPGSCQPCASLLFIRKGARVLRAQSHPACSPGFRGSQRDPGDRLASSCPPQGWPCPPPLLGGWSGHCPRSATPGPACLLGSSSLAFRVSQMPLRCPSHCPREPTPPPAEPPRGVTLASVRKLLSGALLRRSWARTSFRGSVPGSSGEGLPRAGQVSRNQRAFR